MDKSNTNQKFQRLKLSGTTLASEIKHVFGLPNYVSSVDWYDQTCVEQTGFMSVRRLTDSLDLLPKLKTFISSFRDASSFSHVQLFITRPNHKGGWHLDGVNTLAAINIPLFGCSKGCIEWTEKEFTAKFVKSPITTYSTPKESNSDFEPANLKLVLNQMALVKTDSWHRINNMGNSMHRVTASVRFKDLATFDTLQSELKSYWGIQ